MKCVREDQRALAKTACDVGACCPSKCVCVWGCHGVGYFQLGAPGAAVPVYWNLFYITQSHWRTCVCKKHLICDHKVLTKDQKWAKPHLNRAAWLRRACVCIMRAGMEDGTWPTYVCMLLPAGYSTPSTCISCESIILVHPSVTACSLCFTFHSTTLLR